ncbi:MAG: hypothetical protein AAGA48_06330 [Myxococcota bacterium]
MSEAPSRGVRVLLYGVLAAYLLVIVGSALGGNAATDALRDHVTRPLEQVLGIHQTWPMFASVPRRTEWLTAHGQRQDGGEVTLEALPGRPDDQGVRWTYDRLGKLQRNAAVERRKKLRMGIVRWLCRREKAIGQPLSKLQLVRHRSQTPKPGGPSTPRSAFFESRREYSRWNCR